MTHVEFIEKKTQETAQYNASTVKELLLHLAEAIDKLEEIKNSKKDERP